MMQLFLTSCGECVMKDVAQKIKGCHQDMRVAFINTAAEVEEGDHWWVKDEKKALSTCGFQVDEFSITGMSQKAIEERLNRVHILYFCGGNTFYLLDQVIKTGCDDVIKLKINEGVIYIGSSAGSMIVGTRIDLVSTIDESSKAPDLASTGLGIVDMSILPHWGSDDFRKEYLEGMAAMYTEGVKIIPLTNQQYIWVNDESMQIIEI